MKKRMVSIIVVMILLVSMLSGCGLITLNAERDGAQVAVTVDVDGLQGVVTKADLVGFFNQLGYLYIQYYGWTPEKIINEFSTQLANREILLLYATKEIATDKGISIEDVKNANNAFVANEIAVETRKYDKNIRPYDLFNLMDADEQFYVIKQTKKALEENYKTLVDEVKAEFEANAPIEEDKDENKEEDKKDEEDEKKLEPRPQREIAAASTEFKKDSSITADTVAAEKTFFEDKQAKFDSMTDVEQEAYNRLTKTLHKNYKGDSVDESINIAWNRMLDAQKESRIMDKYRDEYVNKGIGATDEEILSRYNFTVSNDAATVFDKDSYKTAIEADKENKLLVHNNKTGYFTVKSILLSFNDIQKKALDAIKKGVMGDTDNEAKFMKNRDQLAIDDKNFSIDGIGTNIGGIKVNVSNPDYDPKAVCTDENCPCKACTNNPDYKKHAVCDVKDAQCPCVACVNNAYSRHKVGYSDILNEMSDDLVKAQNGLVFDSALNLSDDEKNAARLNAKMDMFNDYIYLINDDPGMFNSTGYIMNTTGESQYVAEYVALARALAAKKEVGAVGGLNGVEGFIADTDPDNNIAGTLPNPFDAKKPRITVYSAKSTTGEEIDYIVNDFGIHIIMVTYVVGEDTREGVADADRLTTKLSADSEQYKLNYNYVTKYENVYKTDDKGKVVLDENKNKTLVELKNKTVKDTLADKIIDEKKADTYSKKEKNISDSYKSSIVKNDKVIKKVIKEIEKSMKDQGIDPHDPHHGHNH